MSKWTIVVLSLLISITSFAQELKNLTVEKIMRDPKWIGTSPSRLAWSNDGQYLYFDWNPENAPADSIYFISLHDHHPVKASVEQKLSLNLFENTKWNSAGTAFVYASDGDIFYKDLKTGRTKHVFQTVERESNPQFSFNDSKIVFTSNQNLYAWDITSGETMQLTNLQTSSTASQFFQPLRQNGGRRESKNSEITDDSLERGWLKNDQLQYLEVLKERK